MNIYDIIPVYTSLYTHVNLPQIYIYVSDSKFR